MTREEKAKILDYAIERAYREVDAATGAEMDTHEFHTLLANLTDMEWLLEKATGSCYVSTEVSMQLAEPTLGDTEKIVTEEDKPEQVQPEAPKLEFVPDQVQPEPEPETHQYKMAEVRAALAKARGKGVNVSEIIRSFGVNSFPELAKEQYPAVMRELESRG